MMNFRASLSSRVISASLSTCVLMLVAALPAVGAEVDAGLERVRVALQARMYDAAVTAADAYLAADGAAADEAAYLKAVALYHAEKFEPAAAAAEVVLKDHPNSVWRRKALFLKGSALSRLRKFEAAEAIYEAEAHRLLSGARKKEIAGIIVKYADQVATEPDPKDIGAPPANYAKAYTLYNKALTLEIDLDLREDVMFKRAVTVQRAGNHSQAIADFVQYLNEFDPQWSGLAGSEPRLPVENARIPAGPHRFKARYHLSKSLIESGQHVQARKNLEDLLALLAKAPAPADAGAEDKGLSKLLADAAWQIVRTFQMPQVPGDDIERAVKAAGDFLRTYPDHRHAIEAAFLIARTYEHHGRSDQAVAAYETFIKGDNYKLPPGDVATTKIKRLGKSPAELQDEWGRLAVYQIGQIRFNQRKYAEAIETWQRYVNQFPSGPQWADAQRAIITAEFSVALEAVSQKRYDDARDLFARFLTRHPLDERVGQVLFTLGQMHVAEARKLEEEGGRPQDVAAAYRRAIEEWSRLVSKYPGAEESSLALYRIGLIHEEKLGELEKALEAYRRLNWGSYTGPAQARVAVMTQKQLALATERTFRTNETAKVKLNVRNIERVTVRQYYLDLEAYFRKTHIIGGVDGLDIALIAPDKQWDVKIDSYSKYKPIETAIEIAFPQEKPGVGTPGVCIINVSEDDLESTTLVIRSDLDLIMKTSRRELLVYVQDMLALKPAANVDVLVSDGSKVIAVGRTGDDGVLLKKIDELKDSPTVRVFARRGGSVASNILSLEGLGLSSGLSAKGYIYADRPAYQPGQVVNVRGIIREVKDGQYVAPVDQPYIVTVSDSAGRLLHEETVPLSAFGTFHAKVLLDDASPVGTYTVIARPRDKSETSYSGAFNVQRFQLEKMQLKLAFDRRVYFRGEVVKATVTAEYYWGEPVIGRQVRYTLPDGRTQIATTDKKGKLEIAFDTTPMPVGRPLPFSVRIEGENIGFNDAVFLSRVGFLAELKPARDLVLAGEPFDVKVKTVTPGGEPVGVEEMTLTVLRREVRKADPVLSAVPWINWAQQDANTARDHNEILMDDAWSMPAHMAAEVTVSEHKLSTDPKTGEGVARLTLEKGGQYVLRVAGRDRFQQTIVAQSGVFVSDDDDATRLRLISDRDTLKVGEKATVTLHSRIDNALALVTFEGETILSHRIVALKKGANEIDLEVAHAHYPNFSLAVAAMDDRDLRLANKPFKVERQLHIALKPAKGVIAPGEEAQVDVAVTDQLGRPVRAELSLALVDEALHGLFGSGATPILAFFQQGAMRHSVFLAISTCNFRYAGATRPVVKELLDEHERLTLAERETRELARVQTELSMQLQNKDMLEFNEFNKLQAPNPQGQQAQEGRPGLGVQQLRHLYSSRSGEYGQAWRYGLADSTPGAPGGVNGPALQTNGEIADPRGIKLEGGQGVQAVLRQELPDAGYWIPALVTGDDGKAVATIPMPDNTTKWRLSAKGVSIDTLVGEATAEIVTRKDFFVDIKAPPALREGDKPRVLARVHNLTEYAGPVKLSLVVRSGDMKVTAFTQQINIEKESTTEAIFDAFETPAVGGLQMELTAEAGPHRDALVKGAVVDPWGIAFADHGGGVATTDAAVSLELPKGQDYSSRWLTITVGPSLEQAIVDLALSRLAPQPLVKLTHHRSLGFASPVGAFAGSELLAVVGGLEYTSSVKAPPKSHEALADRARSLVAALVVSQQPSGGWTWQTGVNGNITPDWLVSAMSYWALSRANQLGIKVHADTLKAAETYLANTMMQIQSTDHEGRAVIVHALSVSKSVDFSHLNALHRERQRLSPIALAYTALAFANLERDELAREVLAVLESRVKSLQRDQRELAYWSGEGRYPWLNDDVETTAIALLAMVKAKPTSVLSSRAAEYLMNARGCYGFAPAKARGPAVAALAAHYGRGQQAGDDYQLTILVNGKEVKTIERKGSAKTMTFELPAEALNEKANLVTFRMKGQGRYAYAATLRGFSSDMKDPKTVMPTLALRRHYRHAMLEYRGKPINATSTSPVKNLEIGQRTQVQLEIWSQDAHNDYIVIEESLPAGARLVEGSLQGNFRHVDIGESKLTMYYGPGERPSAIRYELVGYSTGAYRALPTIVRDAMNPHHMRVYKQDAIIVLPPGAASPDPYQMNDAERFALGRAYFTDGLYQEALKFLPELFDRETKYSEREVARMLLWIHTSESFYDARRVVDTFEVLRRRFPDLTIPFDKILTVGRAYRDIGEFERAMLVFRATIDTSFINDSNVSAILQDEGQFLGSIDYQENLWREYPDTADVIGAYFALAQLLYQKAPEAHLLATQEKHAVLRAGAAPAPAHALNGHDPKNAPTKVDLLRQTMVMLGTFLTHYPADPLADDAAFSISNVLLDLKAFETVVKLSEAYKNRYAKSDFASSFQYMIALGHFWRRDYDPALQAAKVVADGESKDRDFARYILGQIYHAEGKPSAAIGWYELVKTIYPDAKQAISYFEEKRIGLEEVTIVRPGKPVNLTLKYRNIKEAAIQVYKVDLMKLYLREKNLSRITAVNLAGISPQLTMTEQLGDGKDYVEKEKTAKLELKEEGAYLVICRGDDLFASGLVLITPLEIEVQEDAVAGQVRANVMDTVTGVRPAEVHVKAIGSADSKFKSGETDLRGLFIAEGLRGTATVIARDADSRYAFYRGKTWLGEAPNARPQAPANAAPNISNDVDYGSNLKEQQQRIQLDNSMHFDNLRRQNNKGVDVNKAFK